MQLSPQGEVQFANAAHGLEQALPATEAAELRARLQAVAAESARTGTAQATALATAGRYFLLLAQPALATGTVALYLTDCTEPYQTAQTVTEQRNFYQSVLNELPGDIAVFDGAHRYLFLNPEAIRNPNIRSWIVGKDDFEYCAYRGFNPERAVMRRQYFERALAKRRGVGWAEMLPAPSPEESTRFFLRRFLPVYHPDGTLNFVLDYGLNISDSRRVEDQLRESDTRLREQQAFQQLVLNVIPATVRATRAVLRSPTAPCST